MLELEGVQVYGAPSLTWDSPPGHLINMRRDCPSVCFKPLLLGFSVVCGHMILINAQGENVLSARPKRLPAPAIQHLKVN